MWNMMCDVMPTISEDSISQRSSQFGDDANFEQLMVSMLDERDKLVDSLKNEQEKTSELEVKVKELEKERDSLNRQLNQNLPQEFASLTKVSLSYVAVPVLYKMSIVLLLFHTCGTCTSTGTL
jgi:predicted  nucleic acid-binding Zn-ribbon protein